MCRVGNTLYIYIYTYIYIYMYSCVFNIWAKATDEILQDGFEILEDPRLTVVDFSLQSVRDLIDYMVSLSLIAAERVIEIKDGKFL